MAINFDSFTEGTTSTIQSNDYVVGFDTAVPGGERKFTVSTIANAVSSIITPAFVQTPAFTGTFKNKLINAQGLINQRVYVSGNATTVANQYTVDRWKVVTSGQNLTFSKADNITYFTAPAGGVEQVIEGLNVETGAYVLNWTGTATATVNGTSRTKGETFSLTGGSNVTVRFIGGTFSLPQLEKGNVPTAFEYRPFGTELVLCQRYYFEAVANSLLSRSIPTRTTMPNAWTDYAHTIVFHTPVTMRVSAAVTVKIYKANTTNLTSPNTLGMDTDNRTISMGIDSDGATGFINLREVTADAEL